MAAELIPMLIVEDNPVYAEILRRLLPTLGTDLKFDVKCVDSAEKAMEELGRGHFELVLLDYKLPGADGLTVLAHIRSQPVVHQPAVIMLTGIGREEIAVAAMKNGAKDYLSKDHLDVPSLLRAITSALERKNAEEALAAERALIRALLDSAPDCIYFKDRYARFTRISRSLAQVLRLPSPEQAIGRTDRDFLPADYVVAAAADEQRILASGQPLIGREEHLVNEGGERWFSSTKAPLMDRFGNITGIVGISRDITEQKKLADELRERNAQLAADIELAREVQEAFLPQSYPCFPHDAAPAQSAIQFYHRYLPTIALGGDFFDVLPISDTQAGVFICDVMGHGVRAALVTALLRGLVEELRFWATDPGQFLTAVNRGLVQILRQTKMPMFATAFYLVIDISRGEIRYSNAGHPSPLCVRRSAGTVDALDFTDTRPGPALGVFDDSVFPLARRQISAKDAILLFTDGIFEVAGTKELFGQERFVAAVLQRSHQASPEMVNGLVSDVRQFAGNTEFPDDVCLIAVDAVTLGVKGST
jgi:sigma-B regulation protein RsbU (phosphoserine phosphatase)